MAVRARPGPARGSQPPGAVAKIVEDPLLVGQPPGVVPGPPVLAAAPQHGNGQDPAPLDEQGVATRERRRHGDVKAPVADEQGRCLPRRGHVVPAGEEQRDGSAVIGGHEDLLAHQGAGVERRRRALQHPGLARGDVMGPQRARVDERAQAEMH